MGSVPPPLPPPPSPIIIGGLNLKICHNFVGTKFFPTFVGGYSSMSRVKLYGLLLHFHYLISL